MDAVGLLERAEAAGLKVTTNGDKLVVRGPRSAEALALELIKNKPEVIEVLRTPSPFDIPFPQGFGGLPRNEVVAALAVADKDGIRDPIRLEIFVCNWVSSGMAWRGELGELYQQVKQEYDRLAHIAFPNEPCYYCDPPPEERPQGE
jgi:hypothetical protein